MTFFEVLGEKISESFLALWDAFISFLPGFLTALILFIVGWIIAVALGKVAGQIIRAIKVDNVLEKMGFKKAMDKAGLKLDTGRFFDELIKWFLILVALVVAVDILGLTQVTILLQSIVLYIPQVIVAALILLVGVLVASFLQKIVVASVEAAHLKQSVLIGTLVKWFVLIFVFFSALMELGIASAQVLFTGLIATLAIAFGLALGLGGKDIAAEFLNKIKRDISGS